MTEIRKKIDQNFFEHSLMVSLMENSYILFLTNLARNLSEYHLFTWKNYENATFQSEQMIKKWVNRVVFLDISTSDFQV